MLHEFDTRFKRLLCFTEYISRNIFAQGMAKIHQIFFRQSVYTVNLPNFPAAKVSLHMVPCKFPDTFLYSTVQTHYSNLMTQLTTIDSKDANNF